MSLKIDRAELEIVIKNDSSRKKMREIEDDMRRIRKEMKGLDESSPQFQGKLAELKKAQAEYDKLVDKIGIAGLSMKELRNRQRELNAVLSQLPGDSPLYEKYRKQLDQVNNRMRELRGTAQSTEGSLSKLAGGLNKFAVMGTAFVATILAKTMALRRLAEEAAKLDDVYSDVIKTTGLTRDEVVELNEEFKKLDTRTARDQLNLLARDAGKLGITGKKNVLDFVEAGNQIRVALGADLGDDAIKNIGKMVSVFENSTEQLKNAGLKEQMLAVGSAINELGMTSTASEPYLVSFAGRLGGISKQAKISMADILGYASALDQDMQAVEMSATALQKFIMKVMGEPAKFAKIAGADVKEFSELLKTDTNAAIKLVLRSLNEKGGFQQLIPIFQEMGLDGARAVGVLSAMAGSIEKVDEAQRVANQAMTEGVSVTNEYNIKNENLAAQLEKARKEFRDVTLLIGEKFTPVLVKSTNRMTDFIKLLIELPKWLKENRFIIIALISTWIAYAVAVNRAVIVSKLADFWNWRLVASFKALTAAMKKSAWGLIITGVILGLAWLNKYLNKQKEVNIEQAEFLKLAEQTKRLFEDNKSLEDRAKAMKSLSKTQLESLQIDLDSQISALEEHDAKIKTMSQKALDDDKELQKLRTKYNEAKTKEEKLALLAPIRWREQALLEGLSSEFSANQKSLKQLRKYKAQVDDLLTTKPDTTGDPDDTAIKERLKQLDHQLSRETLALKQSYTTREKFEEDMLALTTKYITKKRDLYTKDNAEWVAYQIQLEDIRLKNLQNQNDLELETIRESHRSILASIEIFENEKRQQLQDDYEDGLIDKDAYDTELAALDVVSAEKRLQNARLYLDLISNATFDSEKEKAKAIEDASKAVVAAEAAELNAKEKSLKLKKKQEEDYWKKVAELRKELGLDKEILSYQQGLDALKKKLKEAYASEKETADAIDRYKRGKIAEYADAAADVAYQIYNAVSGFERSELTKTEIKYKKQIDAAKKAGKDTTELEEQKEQELSKVRAKYADSKFMLQIAQIGAETARAAIIGYAEGMALGGPILAGVFAGAATLYGLSQVSIAKSERDAAKAGYFDGGYTGGTNPDEVRGHFPDGSPYHGQEFVVNHKGVRNPHVRKFLDVFNNAQLNGTVHMLNTTQILERVRTETVSPGYKAGGYVQDNNRGSDDTELLISVMGRLVRVTDKLNERLDDGIDARAVISGREGIYEQTQRYLQYRKNASRP
jgi:TP901 family phage tail tape measure protein